MAEKRDDKNVPRVIEEVQDAVHEMEQRQQLNEEVESLHYKIMVEKRKYQKVEKELFYERFGDVLEKCQPDDTLLNNAITGFHEVHDVNGRYFACKIGDREYRIKIGWNVSIHNGDDQYHFNYDPNNPDLVQLF